MKSSTSKVESLAFIEIRDGTIKQKTIVNILAITIDVNIKFDKHTNGSGQVKLLYI